MSSNDIDIRKDDKRNAVFTLGRLFFAPQAKNNLPKKKVPCCRRLQMLNKIIADALFHIHPIGQRARHMALVGE